jgi:hypothetical protein
MESRDSDKINLQEICGQYGYFWQNRILPRPRKSLHLKEFGILHGRLYRKVKLGSVLDGGLPEPVQGIQKLVARKCFHQVRRRGRP